MASKRADLTIQGLEDVHVPLTSFPNLPTQPAAYNGETMASDTPEGEEFPSLTPKPRNSSVPYVLRLYPDQLEALSRLKAERGVVPSQFIRDAINAALKKVNER